MKSSPRVALVHDWLVGGGAEQVVLELHKMFPDAPIYTSFCSDEWRDKLDHKVITGFLQAWPFSALRKFLPILRIWWFKNLNLSNYDLIICSSGNGEAKHIKIGKWKMENGKKPVHILYCHTPTHYYWRHYNQYIKNPGFGFLNPIVRLGLKILVKPLRKLDYKAAQQPNTIIANSFHIQADIKKYYHRDSQIIHPPVDTERFKLSTSGSRLSAREGFVTVGRQVPYKKTEIIIEACNKLGLPLTVVGNGPENKKLKKLAGPTITFDTKASDEKVAKYMATAEAFIFAAEEDFGITPVEAMAAGTPVIAYKAGGALDYVITGKTGEFFEKQTVASLKNTLQDFRPSSYDKTTLIKYSEQFSKKQFKTKLTQFVREQSELISN